MKKLFFVLLFPSLTLGSVKAVKATKFLGTNGRETYTFTFQTFSSTRDTFLLLNEDGSWIDLGGVCDYYWDSPMFLQANSTEKTTDSIRFAVSWQLSWAPKAKASVLGNMWFNAALDSSTLNNDKPIGRLSGLLKFNRSHNLSGVEKMRIMVFEIGSTAKDAAQEVTMILTFTRCKSYLKNLEDRIKQLENKIKP